jgi:hypothetical protein
MRDEDMYINIGSLEKLEIVIHMQMIIALPGNS